MLAINRVVGALFSAGPSIDEIYISDQIAQPVRVT
jgi:hypothetical protein